MHSPDFLEQAKMQFPENILERLHPIAILGVGLLSTAGNLRLYDKESKKGNLPNFLGAGSYALAALADHFSTYYGFKSAEKARSYGMQEYPHEWSPLWRNITTSSEFLRSPKVIIPNIVVTGMMYLYPQVALSSAAIRLACSIRNARYARRNNLACDLARSQGVIGE